jgi:hypothetical protein
MSLLPSLCPPHSNTCTSFAFIVVLVTFTDFIMILF